jgi:hypothetical protein
MAPGSINFLMRNRGECATMAAMMKQFSTNIGWKHALALVAMVSAVSVTDIAYAQKTATPALVAPAAKANGPQIQFSERTFDFGKVKSTDFLKHEFLITNTGNAVLEITDVTFGCGCTTAGNWDRLIQPGQVGKLPIQVVPLHFSGPVTKTVTVRCNDPANGTNLLSMQAVIWHPLEIQPEVVTFSQVEGESTNETKLVRIISNLDEPLTFGQPQSTNPLYKAELKIVRPGKEFDLMVSYSGAPVVNPFDTIRIPTSSKDVPVVNINVQNVLQPALVALPAQIQLSPTGLGKPYQVSEFIRNMGQNPISVSEAFVNVPGVTVQIKETERGKSFQLNLLFAADFKASPGQPIYLTVKTTHAKHPIVQVPVIVPAPAPTPAPVAAAAASPAPTTTAAK